jgi:HEPN domain-containing protein
MIRCSLLKQRAGSGGLQTTSGPPHMSLPLCRLCWTTSFFTASRLQNAEKVMKGFLTWHNCTFRKTHSLEEIGEQCLEIDPTLKFMVDRAVPLTEYAWKFRYPGAPDEPEEPSVAEAQEALTCAREVYEAVLSRLPEEVRA